MDLQCESDSFEDYLEETDEIDFSHRSILVISAELFRNSSNEIQFVQTAYEFVRDRISHSWDIQSPRVTCKASDVLHFREGICYAKTNLLSALLRSQGIPAGFCYQRLTLGDTPDTGFCIHALNAVYLRTIGKWIRLDARGNKTGVDAQFSVDSEQLAFPVRIHYDEFDYPTIYFRPNKNTISVLKQAENCLEMYRNGLPECLD